MGKFKDDEMVLVKGSVILEVIAEKYPKANLFKPVYYDDELEGFIELEGESIVKGFYPPGRVNIVLEPNVHEPYSPVDTIVLRAIQSSYHPNTDEDREDSRDEASQPRTRRDPDWREFSEHTGWFGIGIVRGKCAPNHGTLWRSAYQLGASFAFTIGARYNKSTEDTSNVYKTWAKLPFLQYTNWENFMESSPYACPWIAIEMGGIPLPDFKHPTRAVYFLGSEDSGLPSAIVDHCHFTVSIPCIRSMSYNVAVAGSIIMYDRLQKLQVLVGNDYSPELQEAIDEYKKYTTVEEISEEKQNEE